MLTLFANQRRFPPRQSPATVPAQDHRFGTRNNWPVEPGRKPISRAASKRVAAYWASSSFAAANRAASDGWRISARVGRAVFSAADVSRPFGPRFQLAGQVGFAPPGRLPLRGRDISFHARRSRAQTVPDSSAHGPCGIGWCRGRVSAASRRARYRKPRPPTKVPGAVGRAVELAAAASDSGAWAGARPARAMFDAADRGGRHQPCHRLRARIGPHDDCWHF